MLENLHRSQSFVSAIGLAVSLRSLSILSFAILLLWSLSPLGGQSSLRLLSEANSTVVTSRSVYYPNLDANSWLLMSYPITFVNQVSVIVSSSISTADTLQNSSVDLWNHPRVPRVRQLELANPDNDTQNSWVDFGNERAVTYTSLTGLGVVGLEPNTVANFSIPYEYMYADCKPHIRANAKEILMFFEQEFNATEASNYNQLHPNGWPYEQEQDYGDEYNRLFNMSYLSPTSNVYYESSFFLVSPYNLSALWATTGYVFYGTKDLSIARGISMYKCTLHDMELEANIVCDSAACRTTRLRRAIQPRPKSEKPEDFNTTSGRPRAVIQYEYYLRDFIQYFATIGGMITRFSSHPIDNYIYGNSSFGGYPVPYFTNLPVAHNWSAVSDEQVSQRLTEILNTYWEASRWMDITTRTDPFARSSMNQTTKEPFAVLPLNQTTATVSRQLAIYKASLPWIMTLVLCAGTLFVLGLVNIVVALQTSVPDIFGAVSSLTRNNPHIDLPDGGSILDGMDRSRLIKGLRVQLGDVQKREKVGLLTLRSIGKEEPTEALKLQKDRVYL